MSTTLEQTRQLLDDSRSRIDFDVLVNELDELIDAIQSDGTLLETQRTEAASLAVAALEAVKERRESQHHLVNAINYADSHEEELGEHLLSALKDWIFHYLYRGHELSDEELNKARKFVGSFQPNAKQNERKLRGDLERYSWFAKYGAKLGLSINNLMGIVSATKLLPMDPNAAAEIRANTLQVLEEARTRAARPAGKLVNECLDHCSQIIADVYARNGRDRTVRVGQTDSFCIRVCLTDMEKIISGDEVFADDFESLDNHIGELRGSLDRFGFRSSSAVYASFEREMSAFEDKLQRSRNFSNLWEELKDIQSRAKAARRGKAGENQLASFHANLADSELSNLFEALKRKQNDPSELNRELDEWAERMEELAAHAQGPLPGQLKRIGAALKNDSELLSWIGTLRGETKNGALKRVHDLRTRQNELWQIMEENEGRRYEQFVEDCAVQCQAIDESEDLPNTLAEIMQLVRFRSAFGRDYQSQAKRHIDAMFERFKLRAANVGLVSDKIEELEAEIEARTARSFLSVEFGPLFSQTNWLKKWLGLREFPDDKRDGFRERIQAILKNLYRLRARQKRILDAREDRAAEMFAALEAEIAEVTVEAHAAPGMPSTWEALVDTNRQISQSGRFLSNQQVEQLREKLDNAFSFVREARATFAIESERWFAHYNETLSDILLDLEDEPTRDIAFTAIEKLKPLRAALREENRLLKRQRNEIFQSLDVISRSVDQIFESTNADAVRIKSKISAEIDEFRGQVARAEDYEQSHELVGMHKQISAKVREENLRIQDRKELRALLESLWDDISEKLRRYKFKGRQREPLEQTLRRIEQQGWLVFVRHVPTAP